MSWGNILKEFGWKGPDYHFSHRNMAEEIGRLRENETHDLMNAKVRRQTIEALREKLTQSETKRAKLREALEDINFQRGDPLWDGGTTTEAHCLVRRAERALAEGEK